MANQGFRRSFRTPQGYSQTPNGRVALFNQVYLGFVKNNDDAFKMGRLQVWIPEFSSDPNDENQWFTVQYCSPFAGATNVHNNTKEGRNLEDTQTSYGFWAVPPDLENEVVVMFLNGDPNRGIWIGGMFQQFMNHMVPGIPSDASYQDGVDGVEPPVAEYNRWDPNVTNSDNHTRARYTPLHEGLKNQGLYTDPARGPSSAGARRDSVSHAYGFLTPGGNHLVFDDGPDNASIRIRTATGAQVLVNDNDGYVYIISANGNSWFEVSDDGIDAYSAKPISLRAQGDLNFHADGSINMYAKKSFNVYTGGKATMQVGKNLDIVVGGTTNATSKGDMNFLSRGNINQTATTDLNINTGGKVAIETGDVLGITSGGNIIFNAPAVMTNIMDGPKATQAVEASGPELEEVEDHELNTGSNYEEISTKTLASRLPTHEPWSGHPAGRTNPARARVDLNVSSRNQVDGNGNPIGDSNDIMEGEEEFVPTDNATFVAPVTGPITSLFGRRNTNINGASKNHQGVDVGVSIGTSVVAMRDGTVTRAGRAGGYGNLLCIRHDDGYETRYAHLSAFAVKVGQQVKAGQVVARSGNTGVGSGPHLHFEIRKGGKALNPNTKLRNIAKGSRITAGRN